MRYFSVENRAKGEGFSSFLLRYSEIIFALVLTYLSLFFRSIPPPLIVFSLPISFPWSSTFLSPSFLHSFPPVVLNPQVFLSFIFLSLLPFLPPSSPRPPASISITFSLLPCPLPLSPLAFPFPLPLYRRLPRHQRPYESPDLVLKDWFAVTCSRGPAGVAVLAAVSCQIKIPPDGYLSSAQLIVKVME